MSKKHFNYSKQYNNPEQEPKVETQPVQEPEVKLENDIPQTPIRIGVVNGCEKLNVRKGPSKQTNPAFIITKGTKVKVLEELPDWYKITTANGKINGYCMAEFIELR